MKNLVLLSVLFLGACTSAIKDEKSEKENPSSEAMEVVEEFRPEPTENLNIKSKEDLIGYWVGWFEPEISNEVRSQFHSEGNYMLSNKINVSIDRFDGDSVFGHSVVANNNRPFKGLITFSESKYNFNVAEPGDGLHDGSFSFHINQNDSLVRGSWLAFNNELRIKKRIFKLKKRVFEYNPNNELEDWYTDETKSPQRDSIDLVKYLDGRTWEETLRNVGVDSAEVESFSQEEKLKYLTNAVSDYNNINSEFYSVTEAFNDYNSSKDILTSEYVSNLTKADIYILRNSIYARHGYSFKKKDLRNYFEYEEWYMPVHANIKSDLTEIEKQNIKLLLAYEEHAEEYYDEFGR